ncbi:hypothetical protein AX16_010016 [Volvariella volvacea WC 439]|nr:hypothetical protein AX16_010016 [Volvariella volvacea WC 439]
MIDTSTSVITICNTVNTIPITAAYSCDAIGNATLSDDPGHFNNKKPFDAYLAAFGPLVPELSNPDYDAPLPFGVYLAIDVLGDWESDTESGRCSETPSVPVFILSVFSPH